MIIKNNKIINILLLAIILIAGFFLLYILHNIYVNPDKPYNVTINYILVLIIIIASLVLFLRSMSVEKETVVVQASETFMPAPGQSKEKTKKYKEEKSENIDEAEKINVKEIIQNILPAKSSSIAEYCDNLLINLANELKLVQGICHVRNLDENKFSSVALYAYYSEKKPDDFTEGETIPGQVAKDKEIKQITNIPEDFMKVMSGLGSRVPSVLTFIPVLHNDITIAVLELASFKQFDETSIAILNELKNKLADIIFNYIKIPEKIKNDKK